MRRAFMLPSKRPLTAQEEAWLVQIAEKIVRRRLATPAVFLLESLRPMHFVSSQALVLLGPVLKNVVPPEQYDAFAAMLEKPGAIDGLVDEIERQDAVLRPKTDL